MASKTLKVRFKVKSATKAEWESSSLVLLENELALESDTRKIKFGNGTDTFKDLPYANLSPDEINTLIMTNVSYTNDTPMISSLGGLAAGTTFDDMTIQEIFDKLFYPYTKPTISLKIGINDGSSSTSIGIREIGNPITKVKYDATVTKKSEDLSKLEYYSAGNVVSTNSSLNGTNTYSYTYTPTTPINSTTSFKARITDTSNGYTDSSTITANFVRPMYIGYVPGTVTADTLTASDVTGSTMTKLIETKGNKTKALTFNSGRYMFAYPASYNDLKQILDPNKFDNIGSFTKKTLNITCLDDTDVSYKVYIFNNIVDSDNYAMTYNF